MRVCACTCANVCTCANMLVFPHQLTTGSFLCWFFFIKVFACRVVCNSVTGGELFEDIVAREFYSEADARLDYYLP